MNRLLTLFVCVGTPGSPDLRPDGRRTLRIRAGRVHLPIRRRRRHVLHPVERQRRRARPPARLHRRKPCRHPRRRGTRRGRGPLHLAALCGREPRRGQDPIQPREDRDDPPRRTLRGLLHDEEPRLGRQSGDRAHRHPRRRAGGRTGGAAPRGRRGRGRASRSRKNAPKPSVSPQRGPKPNGKPGNRSSGSRGPRSPKPAPWASLCGPTCSAGQP